MSRRFVRTWRRPLKQSAEVLRVVREQPATSIEVAAELEITQRIACAVLRHLWQGGLLSRELIAGANNTVAYRYRAAA